MDYDGRKFLIVNLTGSPYEMGYAYGTLLKEELTLVYPAFLNWVASLIENNVT